MDAALLHPGRFLKSQEFKGKDVTYTLASVDLEEFEDAKKRKKTKGVISFKETSKLFIINRTNTDCIKGMFGRETNDWIGKRVTFYPAPFFDNFTKEHTTAIRVRGSPDIAAPMSVVIRLPMKADVTVTMQRTGGPASAPPPMDGDAIEQEKEALKGHIKACATPEAMDKAWTSGLGAKVDRLPPTDKEEVRLFFKAHKQSLTAKLQASAPAPDSAPVTTPPPA
jgi:hypothetical protein